MSTDRASTNDESSAGAGVDAGRHRRDAEPETYVVVREQTSCGCATVRARGRNETRLVVDYADDENRCRVAALSEGAVVRLELSRAGRRNDVWRAESVRVVEAGGA